MAGAHHTGKPMGIFFGNLNMRDGTRPEQNPNPDGDRKNGDYSIDLRPSPVINQTETPPSADIEKSAVFIVAYSFRRKTIRDREYHSTLNRVAGDAGKVLCGDNAFTRRPERAGSE